MRGYNRLQAVQYALKYGLVKNPNFRYFSSYLNVGGNCTNFVSQCLYAGGAPMDFSFKNPWWYKKSANKAYDKWSFSWAVANSFYYHLKSSSKIKHGLLAIEVPSVNMLNVGDVICYENSKNIIYHNAIITSIIGDQYYISQNSKDAVNIPYMKKAKAMHFFKIDVV